MRHVDLHTHTFYSDGTDDPGSVVRASRMKGVEVLAITDHDNMNGYFDARSEAAKWGTQLIPGVEVSTEVYHILGLNVDPENQDFQSFLERIRETQKNVCGERISMLKDHGIPITLEKLSDAFPRSRVGKYNIVMTLFRDPECRDYCAERYPGASPRELSGLLLNKGGPAAEVSGNYDVPTGEAIYRIHEAGGIAVVAHPFKQVTDMKEMDRLVSLGLDGVEIQPNYGAQNDPFRDYAAEKGLFVTYGSDYHGPSMPRELLGRGYNVIDNLDEILSLRKMEVA